MKSLVSVAIGAMIAIDQFGRLEAPPMLSYCHGHDYAMKARIPTAGASIWPVYLRLASPAKRR